MDDRIIHTSCSDIVIRHLQALITSRPLSSFDSLFLARTAVTDDTYSGGAVTSQTSIANHLESLLALLTELHCWPDLFTNAKKHYKAYYHFCPWDIMCLASKRKDATMGRDAVETMGRYYTMHAALGDKLEPVKDWRPGEMASRQAARLQPRWALAYLDAVGKWAEGGKDTDVLVSLKDKVRVCTTLQPGSRPGCYLGTSSALSKRRRTLVLLRVGHPPCGGATQLWSNPPLRATLPVMPALYLGPHYLSCAPGHCPKSRSSSGKPLRRRAPS